MVPISQHTPARAYELLTSYALAHGWVPCEASAENGDTYTSYGRGLDWLIIRKHYAYREPVEVTWVRVVVDASGVSRGTLYGGQHPDSGPDDSTTTITSLLPAT